MKEKKDDVAMKQKNNWCQATNEKSAPLRICVKLWTLQFQQLEKQTNKNFHNLCSA